MGSPRAHEMKLGDAEFLPHISVPGALALTIGKVFGHCDKLTKDNYEVWLAGLLSAIAGLTIVSEFYKQLEETIDYLKQNAHLAIEVVSEYIGHHILKHSLGERDRLAGPFAIFNTQLFHIFNLTISDSLASIMLE